MASSLDRVAHELARGLETAAGTVTEQGGPRRLLNVLGWEPPPGVEDIGLAAVDLSALVETIGSLELELEAGTTGAALDAKFAELVLELQQALTHVRAILSGLNASGEYVAKTHIDEELLPRLTSLLAVSGLASISPFALLLLQLCGVVTLERHGADPSIFQADHIRPVVNWDAVGRMFSDPVGQIQSTYGWGSGGPGGFDANSIVANLGALIALFGVPVRQRVLPRQVEEQLAGVPVPEADDDPATQVIASLLRGPEATGLDVGISLYPLRPTAPGADDGGLGVSPYVHGTSDLRFPLSDQIAIEFQTTLALDSGLALQIRPRTEVTVTAGLLGAGGVVEGATGHALVLLSFAAEPNSSHTLFSLPGGGVVEATSIALGGGVDLARGGLTPGFVARVAGGHAALRADEGDSFLKSLLPPGGLEAHFDLGLRWTGAEGFSFEGSAAAGADLPVHLSLAGFRIDFFHVGLAASPAGLPLDLSVTGGASLGPLDVSVERVGVRATLAFQDGSLGPVDLSFAFKPPTAVGLSVDSGLLTGGGFLRFDPDRGQYDGALQLVFADTLGLSAIALITTRQPDGSPGFSLLIVITADFGAGIQLGFGFTLLAVGGLLGLNRAVRFEALLDGVRTGAVEAVMFPKDVVANAPRIISDLQAFFPAQRGTLLIGPLAKLGWGQPTLIRVSLGVVVEIPPGEIAILGVLRLALPTEQAPVLVLQANFVGALEFGKQRLYFFASLDGSRILFIPLEGELGVLFAYGAEADFVLSVGGFHPQFDPPPLPFPTPKRLQLDLINESYARIRCDGYFAVTTNTVQFGASAEFFFGLSALSVSGHAGFDALIQFSPFHFTTSISTTFSVKVLGVGVFGVDIDLTLDGPTPWHAHGKGSISFFFFSIGVPIDVTWGDERDTALPPVAVFPFLAGELAKESNWRTVLPSGSNVLVSLRSLDPSEARLVLHPVGTLQVSQRAVPLNLVLDRVGSQRPTDANRFTLRVTSTELAKKRDLQEPFAPAQFRDFDDGERLAQPAYTPLDSGVELSASGDAYASGTAITRIVRYDLSVVDTKLLRARKRFFDYVGTLFVHLLAGASVARSPLSGHQHGLTHPFEAAVSVAPELHVVARQADNTAFAADATAFTSRAAAADYLSRAVAADPALAGSLHVLPEYEVAA